MKHFPCYKFFLWPTYAKKMSAIMYSTPGKCRFLLEKYFKFLKLGVFQYIFIPLIKSSKHISCWTTGFIKQIYFSTFPDNSFDIFHFQGNCFPQLPKWESAAPAVKCAEAVVAWRLVLQKYMYTFFLSFLGMR